LARWSIKSKGVIGIRLPYSDKCNTRSLHRLTVAYLKESKIVQWNDFKHGDKTYDWPSLPKATAAGFFSTPCLSG
jgi:hypothetical protein